jgi:AcrR family transcriptional regulator
LARLASIDKEDIIKKARLIFCKNGIAATEMKEIAALCGIGRSSLYRYFETKETLALSVASEILHEFIGGLEASVPRDGTGFSAVECALSRFVQELKGNIEMVRFLDDFDSYFSDGYPISQTASQYQTQVGLNTVVLMEALQRGTEDGSLRLIRNTDFTARYLVNALLGVAQRVLPRKDILRQEQGYAQEYLDQTLETLLYQLKGR